MSNKDTTVMRLDKNVIEKIREMAKADDRTMKSFVKKLIEKTYIDYKSQKQPY